MTKYIIESFLKMFNRFVYVHQIFNVENTAVQHKVVAGLNLSTLMGRGPSYLYFTYERKLQLTNVHFQFSHSQYFQPCQINISHEIYTKYIHPLEIFFINHNLKFFIHRFECNAVSSSYFSYKKNGNLIFFSSY